jgi:hypothetical protein
VFFKKFFHHRDPFFFESGIFQIIPRSVIGVGSERDGSMVEKMGGISSLGASNEFMVIPQ